MYFALLRCRVKRFHVVVWIFIPVPQFFIFVVSVPQFFIFVGFRLWGYWKF